MPGFTTSPLASLMKCQKDVLYSFLSDGRINWRNILYALTIKLWNKIEVRGDHKNQVTCLMIDDTDYAKTGRKIENIGMAHSYKERKSILGFKGLFLGVTDGKRRCYLTSPSSVRKARAELKNIWKTFNQKVA